MIIISGNAIEPDEIARQYPPGSVERKIINILSSSSEAYRYPSLDYLKFELNLRKNIVNAARELYRSNFSFEVFRKSKCNPDYWERTDEGGFLLENNVKPSDAINDIFINSSKYATECSTAIVIVFYKALLDIFPKELFDRLFGEIYLMNWQHLNRNLGVEYYRNVKDFLPGDCRYFKNPDVDPQTPEWQGENAIDMGNGTFYGHGIGIAAPEKIIDALNRNRIEGAERSAYLLDAATRPDFMSLARQYYSSPHPSSL